MLSLVICPVALYPATPEAEAVRFKINPAINNGIMKISGTGPAKRFAFAAPLGPASRGLHGDEMRWLDEPPPGRGMQCSPIGKAMNGRDRAMATPFLAPALLALVAFR